LSTQRQHTRAVGVEVVNLGVAVAVKAENSNNSRDGAENADQQRTYHHRQMRRLLLVAGAVESLDARAF
jgi:hypothetical protein